MHTSLKSSSKPHANEQPVLIPLAVSGKFSLYKGAVGDGWGCCEARKLLSHMVEQDGDSQVGCYRAPDMGPRFGCVSPSLSPLALHNEITEFYFKETNK